MKKFLKKFYVQAATCVLIPFVLIWASSPPAAGAFTWKALEWDGFKRTSEVYNKLGADSLYANVYLNMPSVSLSDATPAASTSSGAAGTATAASRGDHRHQGDGSALSIGDNQPGPCNNGTYRGRFWYDTSGADSGLKWCNNEDGSYHWDPMAQADELKAGVMKFGTTGTLPYLRNRTFTTTAALERVFSGNTCHYGTTTQENTYLRNFCTHRDDGRGTFVSRVRTTQTIRYWRYSSAVIGEDAASCFNPTNAWRYTSITCNGYYN